MCIGYEKFKTVQVNEATGSNLECDHGAFVGSRGVDVFTELSIAQRFPFFALSCGIKAGSKLNEVACIVSHRQCWTMSDFKSETRNSGHL